MYCHEASPTDIASPQLLAHFMLPDASFSSYFCFVLYMRSYWRERCVKPNFIITDILSARIFAVLLNALSLFLVVVSFLYALASVDKMHEMCFHGNNGTEMNVKKKTKITSEKSCACNCVHHRDATDFCVETETDVYSYSQGCGYSAYISLLILGLNIYNICPKWTTKDARFVRAYEIFKCSNCQCMFLPMTIDHSFFIVVADVVETKQKKKHKSWLCCY